jgi:hypothetical protein
METSTGSVLLWGLLLVVAGAFFSIYGLVLFRYVLSMIGFVIGFSIGMQLASGMEEFLQIVVAIVLGGIGAAILFFMFRVGLWIAGAIFGLVLALIITSFLSLDAGALRIVGIAIGLVLGAFFGRVLGDLIIVLATSTMGAYTIVYGLALIFPQQMGAATIELAAIPVSWFTLALLGSFVAVSALAQLQIMRLRDRLTRR